MPTCSKGEITKTVSGTIKLTWKGLELKSTDIKDKSASDKWNNCKCGDNETFVEIKCITSSAPEKNVPKKGTADLGDGFQVEYDLTVDTTRDITNCEYECKKKLY